MKKIFAIALLLSSVNLINGATWAEMFQEAVTGRPAAVSTAPAVRTGEVVNAPVPNQSPLDQIRNTIPALIANIRLLAPKVMQLAQSPGGLFSGISAAFTDPDATAAFLNLKGQLTTVVGAAQNLLTTADSSTKATVQGLLRQVTSLPEFKQFVDYAKNIPVVGSQIESYLGTLTQDANVK